APPPTPPPGHQTNKQKGKPRGPQPPPGLMLGQKGPPGTPVPTGATRRGPPEARGSQGALGPLLVGGSLTPTFSHPDCTVGSGFAPDRAAKGCRQRAPSAARGLRPRGAVTTGRELPAAAGPAHPAPKVAIRHR